MKKLFLYCIVFVSTSIAYDHQSQPDNTKTIDENIDVITIYDQIAKLQAANKKIMEEIVNLQADLAKMRVSQGGKGAFKPQLQHAAQKLIQKIQDHQRQIMLNKSDIQTLELLDPNREEKVIQRPKAVTPRKVTTPEKKTTKK